MADKYFDYDGSPSPTVTIRLKEGDVVEIITTIGKDEPITYRHTFLIVDEFGEIEFVRTRKKRQ